MQFAWAQRGQEPSRPVYATPLSAGSKTLSPLLHLKVTYGWLLFFLYHLNEKLKKVSEKFGR